MSRTRLDQWLVEKGFASSREKAQALILAGRVWRGQERLDKPGFGVPAGVEIRVEEGGEKYRSRGGFKLEHALHAFSVETEGRICIDIGASTGGFTDCLLQHGATHVFAIDVGYGQLDASLRSDSRVSVLERCNARHLKRQTLLDLHGRASKINMGVADVSFISLRVLLPHLSQEFPHLRDWIVLFKPQFEVGREAVGKHGLVRDRAAVDLALSQFCVFMEELGWRLSGAPVESPVPGKKSGNIEYLIFFSRTVELR